MKKLLFNLIIVVLCSPSSNSQAGDNASIEDLRDATPRAFTRTFLKGLPTQTGGADISFDNIEILGQIKEGETVHVLSRLTVGAGDLSVTRLEVISFAPYNNGWGILLNGKMSKMTKAIRAKALH